MNTLTSDNQQISKLDQLSQEDLLVYKAFFTIMFKMGRETKHILKYKPDLSLSEYPHLIMLNNQAKYVSIYYSIENKSWIIQRKAGEKEKFNPKAISGIIEFLSHFDNGIVLDSIQITEAYITSLINTYVKNP